MVRCNKRAKKKGTKRDVQGRVAGSCALPCADSVVATLPRPALRRVASRPFFVGSHELGKEIMGSRLRIGVPAPQDRHADTASAPHGPLRDWGPYAVPADTAPNTRKAGVSEALCQHPNSVVLSVRIRSATSSTLSLSCSYWSARTRCSSRNCWPIMFQ
jgi:hypothetical protein